MIPLLANEHGTEFQLREQQSKTEWNSENRVRCNYTTSWMNFQVHARSSMERMQECVPMRVGAKKKLILSITELFVNSMLHHFKSIPQQQSAGTLLK